VHGEEAAQKAQDDFVKKFQKREMPLEVALLEVASGERLVEVMARAGLAESRSEAKRKIKQGGVSLAGELISDINFQFNGAEEGQILKVGKKQFRKVVFKD